MFHIYRDCFRELNKEKNLRRFNRKIIESSQNESRTHWKKMTYYGILQVHFIQFE